jgi:hypothetical protein
MYEPSGSLKALPTISRCGITIERRSRLTGMVGNNTAASNARNERRSMNHL